MEGAKYDERQAKKDKPGHVPRLVLCQHTLSYMPLSANYMARWLCTYQDETNSNPSLLPLTPSRHGQADGNQAGAENSGQ